ncbi:MAG: hypothetical protein ABJQ69_03715 [Ekhidna sp.]
MKTATELRLFMVVNAEAFTRYEDHEAGIYLQVYELIQSALEEDENPIGLIQDYLGVTYTLGDSINELTSFLFHTGEMMAALQDLKENWQVLDKTLPEDSLMFGGTSKEEATEIYAETTLRNYLEALSEVTHG